MRPRRPLVSVRIAPPHTGTGTAVLFPQSSPSGSETRGNRPGAAEGGAARAQKSFVCPWQTNDARWRKSRGQHIAPSLSGAMAFLLFLP